MTATEQMASEEAITSRPEWVRDAIFYQIFPDRYARSTHASTDVEPWDSAPTRDNFLGGDLDGITEHLEHLSDLGVTAVYFTPIFAAGTNHRYDTEDYLRIDSRLGDEASFARLVDRAHAHGIRVVLDAVFHHCGWGHWAFEDVRRNGADSPYVNWFYADTFPISADPEPNYGTCSGCWYLPKLNVEDPGMRAYLFDVARHWTSLGIDGWRLDVPYMMDNLPFWQEFRRVVREIDPECYIVAEVWDRASDWTSGQTSDAAMNYRLRDALLAFLVDRRSGAGAFAAETVAIAGEIGAQAMDHMLNLLASHDTARLRTTCGGEAALTRLALGLLFALRGAPMVYYGDEVGALGFNDPECRAAMRWDPDDWDHETMRAVRELAALRTSSIALRRGEQSVSAPHDDVVAVTRTHPEQTVTAYANRLDVPVTVPARVAGRNLLSGAAVTGTITLPRRGITFVEEGTRA